MSATEPRPFDQFVIKVVSRCNLACDYCYEYFHGDESWRKQPRFMSVDTLTMVARRIAAHARAHDMPTVSISLHGGEPMLAGLDRLSAWTRILRSEIGAVTEVGIGAQSNGTMYSPEIHAWAVQERVTIGVSVDGPPHVNDRRRHYANGSASSPKVERALTLLRGTEVFAGILSVIDVKADPVETLAYLGQWGPPILDFLLPHGNWLRLPPGVSRPRTDAGPDTAGDPIYGRWLAAAFDAWWTTPHLSRIAVRTFEEIILRLAGRPGVLETLGTEPVTLITIATDGSYEGVDTLKSALPGAHVLGLHVRDTSLDDVLRHPSVAVRQSGLDALHTTCRHCPFVGVCGGGYLPHRVGADGTFTHPSVYCPDLAHLIRHVASVLRQHAHGAGA